MQQTAQSLLPYGAQISPFVWPWQVQLVGGPGLKLVPRKLPSLQQAAQASLSGSEAQTLPSALSLAHAQVPAKNPELIRFAPAQHKKQAPAGLGLPSSATRLQIVRLTEGAGLSVRGAPAAPALAVPMAPAEPPVPAPSAAGSPPFPACSPEAPVPA